MTSISVIFRRARDAKNLSQMELAERINISQKAYANYEADVCKPKIAVLSKICEVLELDIFDMLRVMGVNLPLASSQYGQTENSVLCSDEDDFMALYFAIHKSLKKVYEVRLREKDETIRWLRSQLDKSR